MDTGTIWGDEGVKQSLQQPPGLSKWNDHMNQKIEVQMYIRLCEQALK